MTARFVHARCVGSARFARSALHIHWAGSARFSRSALHVRWVGSARSALHVRRAASARFAHSALHVRWAGSSPNERTAALLAEALLPPMHADARTTALLALALQPPMRADARFTALLACALFSPMHACPRVLEKAVVMTRAPAPRAQMLPYPKSASCPRAGLRSLRSLRRPCPLGGLRSLRSLRPPCPLWAPLASLAPPSKVIADQNGPHPKNRKCEKYHVASSFATHATPANVICSGHPQLIPSEPWTYSPRDFNRLGGLIARICAKLSPQIPRRLFQARSAFARHRNEIPNTPEKGPCQGEVYK